MQVAQASSCATRLFSQPQVQNHQQKPGWKTVVFDFFKQLPNSGYQRLPSFKMPSIVVIPRQGLQTLGAQASSFTSWLPSCKLFTNRASSALPQDLALKIKRLDNGLTYYVRNNHYPLPGKAYFHLVIRAGMLNETEREKGIAHLVEHIAQTETAHFSKHEITEYLHSKGVRWGRDANAHTAPQETVYKLAIPLDDPDTLEKAIFILSEVASKATLSDEIIENEREIVIDELKLRESVSLRYTKEKLRIASEGTPYATLIDRAKEIKSVKECPADTIRAFYKRWYQPENIALIAVGDFDPNQTSKLIEKYFGNIPTFKSPLSKYNYCIKEKRASRILCFSDPEMTKSKVEIHYQLPPLKYHGIVDRKVVERNLTAFLFKTIFNQRLAECAEEEKFPFVRAACNLGETIPDWPSFELSAQAKEGQIPLAFKQLLLEIKRIKAFGFLQSEFDRAKKSLLAGYDHLILEKGKTSTNTFIGQYQSHFIHNQPLPDIDEMILLKREILGQINLDAVNAMTSYLLPNHCLILTAEPKKTGLSPVTPEILKREISNAAKEKILPPTAEPLDQPLLKHPPIPEEIDITRFHKKINVTEYTLKNGLRVLVKPTTFENNRVVLKAYSPRGIRDAKLQELVSAKFSEDFFDACGIGDFDRKTLRKILQEKQITYGTSIHPYRTSIHATAVPKDLESIFQLSHLLFTNPGYDRTAFERALEKKKENLRNQRNDPDAIYHREYLAINTQNHPELKSLTLDDLKLIDYEVCKNFHRKLHLNPADFTIIITGAVQEQKLKQLIECYLATIPKIGKKDPRRDYPPVPLPPGITRKDVVTGKTNSLSILTFPAPIRDTFKETCLSKWCCALLEWRLNKILRFEMGKTYMQRCSFIQEARGLNPGNPSQVRILLTGDPDMLQSLEIKALEQIRDLQINGPTDTEVSSLKKQLLQDHSNNMKTNTGWIEVIRTNCEWKSEQDDFDEIVDKKLKWLTPLAAKEHFKTIFPLNQYTVVTKIPKNSAA